MNALASLLAWAMAAVVTWRCFMVIYHMDVATKQCSLARFWAFGLSYAVLMVAALGAAVHISEGQGITGDWLFLLASAGLILSDRRSRRANTFKKIARATTTKGRP